MKKALPIIIIILAAAGIGYNFINHSGQEGSSSKSESVNTGSPTSGSEQVSSNPPLSEGTVSLNGDADTEESTDETKPAAIAYKNAQEALEAIKKGAKDYDDTILEQFTLPGEDCTFCAELYTNVKELLKSSTAKNEEKAFFAEILAISGKVDNIQALVDGFKNGANSDEKELYSSALELTAGKDDVVKYLGKELSTTNNDLKESLVAALTNQGSELAFDTLYKHVVEAGDPNGYYTLGIGPAEMMLDEKALAKAEEYAQKRDAFAPLAVKAMLNNGLPGLRMVMDILSTSSNIDQDRNLTKGAVEHVGYDEQIEKYLQEKVNDPRPLVRDFAKQILDDYSHQEEANQEPVQDEAPITKAN